MHSPFAYSIWGFIFLLVLCISRTSTSYSVFDDDASAFDLSYLVSKSGEQGRYSPKVEEQIPLGSSQRRNVFPEEMASSLSSTNSVFAIMLDAVDVMQSHYFAIWQGTWPSAIDWTAAVMGTQISATLSSISETLSYFKPQHCRLGGEGCNCIGDNIDMETAQRHENLINQYFTQITSFYFGENAFSLRTQAYDDMLWVVLGWLESVKFIKLHSKLLYHASSTSEDDHSSAKPHRRRPTWYAQQFIPQFSHRAHVFYDLASKGWDTSLCGGGMVWNPYLAPYKNAITNQLYIAASVSMYLYFPGDDNSSPFSSRTGEADHDPGSQEALPPAKAHDEHYLTAAITAYDWLKKSNMTNAQGLYVDGFHITGWRGGKNASRGTGNCDLRDNNVYTYNQGVILSGLRGLFDATANIDYLIDAHELISNVIAATGWESRNDLAQHGQWAGLGRGGVMEESCDHSGTCSQNGHTFKGIFFHHLMLFCKPLANKSHDERDEDELQRIPKLASKETASLHTQSCKSYGPWIEWNARAAYATKNRDGEYGTWWGWHDDDNDDEEAVVTEEEPGREDNEDSETDYRNQGVPNDEIWRIVPSSEEPVDERTSGVIEGTSTTTGYRGEEETQRTDAISNPNQKDVNDRGRGRTVETQSGGLAVIRALWDWRTWYRL